MTGFTNTPFGKAWVDILKFFGVDATKAATEVNTDAAEIDTDVEGLVGPLLPELEALGEPALKAIVAAGVNAVKTAAAGGTGAEDILDVAYDAVSAAVVSEAKTLTPAAINILASVIPAHIDAAASSSGTTTADAAATAPDVVPAAITPAA